MAGRVRSQSGCTADCGLRSHRAANSSLMLPRLVGCVVALDSAGLSTSMASGVAAAWNKDDWKRSCRVSPCLCHGALFRKGYARARRASARARR